MIVCVIADLQLLADIPEMPPGLL